MNLHPLNLDPFYDFDWSRFEPHNIISPTNCKFLETQKLSVMVRCEHDGLLPVHKADGPCFKFSICEESNESMRFEPTSLILLCIFFNGKYININVRLNDGFVGKTAVDDHNNVYLLSDIFRNDYDLTIRKLCHKVKFVNMSQFNSDAFLKHENLKGGTVYKLTYIRYKLS